MHLLPRQLVWPVLLGAVLLGTTRMAVAQVTVRGFVSIAASGQTLPGATVALADSAGTVVRVATDSNGLYQMSGLAQGQYLLQVSFVGFQTAVDTLELAAGVQHHDVSLAEATGDLGEAIVTDRRPSGTGSVRAGFQRIRPSDIATVPSPDVTGDLATYLTTLPGVVTSGDQGGQLFIRGGEPAQNLTLLDGIALAQPFHLLGFYSAFPADLIASADFFAGSAPARYGGRLSSVLDVTARTGNLEQIEASASVSPLVVGALAEGPLARNRSSVLVSARRSVIDQGAAHLITDAPDFVFGDLLAKVTVVPNTTNRFTLTGLYSSDEGALGDSASVRPTALRYTTSGGGLRYVSLPGRVPILVEVLVSLSESRSALRPLAAEAQSPTRTSRLTTFRTDVNLTYSADLADLRGGVFVHYSDTASELGGLFEGIPSNRLNAVDFGLYVEPEVAVGEGLRVTPGLRLTSVLKIGDVSLEPRLRAVFERGLHRLTAAAGLYSQPLVGLNDRRDATSVFTAFTLAPRGRMMRSASLVGGYGVRPMPWLETSVEGYVTRLRDLSVGRWSAVPELTTHLVNADGTASGFDLRAEARTTSGFFASASLGWARVSYDASDDEYDLWYGAETLRYHPPHDRRVQASTVINVPVLGFDVAARWQFGSGTPFSRALGFDVYAPTIQGNDVYTQPGSPRVIYERPYTGRLPAYHRLDVTLQRAFPIGKTTLTAQAGVINAYDRRNLFAFDVFTLQRVDQLPLLPTFSIRLATP